MAARYKTCGTCHLSWQVSVGKINMHEGKYECPECTAKRISERAQEREQQAKQARERKA